MAGRWEILSKKLKDVGTMRSSGTVVETKSSKKDYPDIYGINEKQLPGLKNMKVGDKVKFIAEGEIQSTSKRNNDPTSYDIEIKKMVIVKGEK